MKQEFPPELDWFTDLHVRVDLGYLGMKADDHGEQSAIPTKKPHKSQKNPNPQLSDEQKAANTALSRMRIFIAHAIGSMKYYNILVHTLSLVSVLGVPAVTEQKVVYLQPAGNFVA